MGPYEIAAPLGAGAMGEVYRARDLRLKREVALKLLPDAFSHNPERLARFEREAHLLASVNHTNIAQIYGLDEIDGHLVLAMELVPGESLAARLARGALPVMQALNLARQIADALEAAHERGIVHRDLKPANIMLTPDDQVKVLDFGIAKGVATDGSLQASDTTKIGAGPASWPTATMPALVTSAGMVLGTAAYMSPEQARGRAADKRSDVWAFGCVLYEMLTGRRAFGGAEATDTLAAVIMKEVDSSALPRDVPSVVKHLIDRCLEKDVKQRLRDIGEARILLARSHEEPSTPRAARVSWLPWAVAAAALMALAWAVMRSPAPTPSVVSRFLIDAPPGGSFVTPGPMLAMSPDGRTLAFVAINGEGQRILWLRRLDSIDATEIRGTNDAFTPFWSPDSRLIGFFAEEKLKIVEPTSGRVQVLSDMKPSPGDGGTWVNEDLILAAGNPGSGDGIYRLSTGGGPAVAVIDVKRAPGLSRWRSPVILPDGRRFLFVARDSQDTWRAYATDLDGTPPRFLFETESKVEYVEPGRVVFVAGNRLLSQGFDAASLSLRGEPVVLGERILGSASNARKAFSVSSGGVLAFRELRGTDRVVLYDRAGRRLREIGKAGDSYPVAFSPDGSRVLFRRDGDVWVTDINGVRETRLSFDPGDDGSPVWSPDSRSIALVRSQSVVRIAADGKGQEQRLGPARVALIQWLPSGLLSDGLGGTRFARFPGEWERLPGLPEGAREAQVSMDGKWIAYALEERGGFQIYVQSLADGGGRWQVSRTGGRQPRWRRDAKELFFLATEGHLASVSVDSAGRFDANAATPLFAVGATTGLPDNVGFYYDVGADGQRFVFSTRMTEETRTPITVLLNWQAAATR